MLKLRDLRVVYREATIPNGAKLVFFERQGTPLHLQATFFGGAQLDPPGKEGTAHFLEHMLVAGTREFPTKDKLAAFIEQYGGEFSAFTGEDTISINVGIGDPNDIEKAVFVLGEILANPLFNEKTIETERGSILNELDASIASPGRRIWDVWRGLFFQGTPAERPILGTKESISAISNDDLIEFYHQHILAGRAVVVASGGVLEETLQTGVARAFSPRAMYTQGTSFAELPVIREKTMAIESYEKNDQIHALFGFRTRPAGGNETPVLNLIAEVLGGGRASVLQRRLRYEKGLVYSVSATSYKLCNAGAWVINVSFAKPKIREVMDIITSELQRVASRGLTKEELRFAKDRMVKSKLMTMQTSGSWVGFHSFKKFIQDTPWTIEDYCREIEAVDLGIIQKTAQEYFRPDTWYLAMCGNIQGPDVQIAWQ